ncbi:Uncharacterised protein [Vibrio cholerae]|nr:Uncharacterised protein [Vibrio cholerae]CSC88215.1 Uncharacterised protein [Vibrio cholerae]
MQLPTRSNLLQLLRTLRRLANQLNQQGNSENRDKTALSVADFIGKPYAFSLSCSATQSAIGCGRLNR